VEFRTVAIAVITVIVLLVLILLAITISGTLQSGVNESIGFLRF